MGETPGEVMENMADDAGEVIGKSLVSGRPFF